mgnify:CR=1 FL=1
MVNSTAPTLSELVRLVGFYALSWLYLMVFALIGMVAVLLFIAIAGSFKAIMVGQITDSVLGHLEVHRKGYVASIDTLPLNLNLRHTVILGGVGTAAVSQGALEVATGVGAFGLAVAHKDQAFHRAPHTRRRLAPKGAG